MRIVVAGASGFVGGLLIPLLSAKGCDLLLVGRDRSQLRSVYPTLRSCGYDELEQAAAGFDVLVNLVTVNNDVDTVPEEFHRVNVGLMLDLIEKAGRAGIDRFINVSSIHALDESNTTPYAESKRAAVSALETVTEPVVFTVYLPLIYGPRWAGKLAPLNRLPRFLATPLFTLLAAFKPTLHISGLAEFVVGIRKGMPSSTILTDGQRDNVAFKIAKRMIDLSFAITVVLVLWWALLLIWIAVRAGSKGPGIFAQPRIGQNGRIFTCYKFRTMATGTAHLGTHEVARSAITAVGTFLRRSKLDELPQVINILRNEVSLIGPRPCLPIQQRLVDERRARGLLALTPGISGLAQVNDIDMSDPERLAEWDARYLALQSLTLDLRIMLATALGRGQGDRHC